jgi:hypothetical protein
MTAAMVARADQIAALIQETLDGIRSGDIAVTEAQSLYLLGVADGLAVVRGLVEFVPPNPPRLDRTDG